VARNFNNSPYGSATATVTGNTFSMACWVKWTAFTGFYAGILESRSNGLQGLCMSGAGVNSTLAYSWEATADEYNGAGPVLSLDTWVPGRHPDRGDGVRRAGRRGGGQLGEHENPHQQVAVGVEPGARPQWG
jgi:hypothetical protein